MKIRRMKDLGDDVKAKITGKNALAFMGGSLPGIKVKVYVGSKSGNLPAN